MRNVGPDGGRKEYRDQDGQAVRVLEWFGYKLHLVCDSRHEVALAYKVTAASVSDNQPLESLVQEAKRNLPEGRMKTLAYDKACDDEGVQGMLARAGVRPVIQARTRLLSRSLCMTWRNEFWFVLFLGLLSRICGSVPAQGDFQAHDTRPLP